ncbi:MAG: hypothetical protein IAE67_07735 [Candidatus Competibacteraceae bacterium]|nr:hypothetical protein [Candidatus Competibacteraceae bacterium]
METTLLLTHSALRYIVLIAIIYTVIRSWSGLLLNKEFNPIDRKAAAIAMGLVHIQVLIGIALYIIRRHFDGFTVMKALKEAGNIEGAAYVRFWAIEHIAMMLIAAILITIGQSVSKKAHTPQGKYLRLTIFFTLGLLIIFAGIPWPFIKSWGVWL